MPYIKTLRLVLREYRAEDLPGLHSVLSDAAVMRFIMDMHTETLEGSRQNLETAMQAVIEYPRDRVFLAVEEAESGHFVGSMGYTVSQHTPAGRVAEAGYFFLPAFHGRGYAAEAFAALLCYAFQEGGVYRMTAGCFAANKASCRVMEKCGMVREGYYKEAAWLEGKMADRLSCRLLRSEWMALQMPENPGRNPGGNP